MDISNQITETDEYKVFSSYIAEPDNVDDTLTTITNLVQDTYESSRDPEGDVETHLGRAWNSILILASETAHDSSKQDKLVDLMSALVSQRPLKDSTGEPVVISGGRVWMDLPLFGQQVRESWNFPDDREVDQKTRDKWINVNAFVARLTAASWKGASFETDGDIKSERPALDFSLYGIWAARSALEENLGKEGNTVDALIGAAAVWTLYAGTALKGLCHGKRDFQGKVARSGTKYKGEDWKGYNQDRRQIWGNELSQSEDSVQDEGVRELVASAMNILT